MYQLQCDICGNNFEHNQPNTRRCSATCRQKFVNRKSNLKQQARKKRKIAERNSLPQSCIQCGSKFIHNRKRKYCSDACMTEVTRRHIMKRCRECKILIATGLSCEMCKRLRHIPQIGQCVECNQSFEVGHKTKFCSPECRRRDDRRRYPSRYRRRAKKYGVTYDKTLTLQSALKQFGRLCYLCQELLFDTPNNHPDEPVLEHIKSLANGGTHTWDNVNVAHRRCNDVKAATIDTQERLNRNHGSHLTPRTG